MKAYKVSVILHFDVVAKNKKEAVREGQNEFEDWLDDNGKTWSWDVTGNKDIHYRVRENKNVPHPCSLSDIDWSEKKGDIPADLECFGRCKVCGRRLKAHPGKDPYACIDVDTGKSVTLYKD